LGGVIDKGYHRAKAKTTAVLEKSLGSDAVPLPDGAPEDPSPTRPIAIFLCDDVPGFRALARIALEQAADLRVVGEASDPASAMEPIAELDPDVVLLDLGVPMEGGLDAIRRLRSLVPEACVIVLSGLPPDRAAGPALAGGAHRYLEKGVPWEAVRLAIRRCVQDRRGGELDDPA
jgi:DNA-binding NarL/FixJ family response regulator